MVAMTLGAAMFSLLAFILTLTLSIAASPIVHTQQRSTPKFDAPTSPPVFVSTPPLTATEDVTYTYAVKTLDPDRPDGNGLSLTLLRAPAWLSFHESPTSTATLRGLPTNEDVGEHAVSLMAVDGSGLATTQHFTITVLNVNDAPSIGSNLRSAFTAETFYHYNIWTYDPDVGDTITLTALTLPNWLIFTSTDERSGTLFGTPTHADIDTDSITFQVQDAAGLTTVQHFDVTIKAPRIITTGIKGKVTAAGFGVAGVDVYADCYTDYPNLCLVFPSHTMTDIEGNFSFNLGAMTYEVFFVLPAAHTPFLRMIVSVLDEQVTILPDIVVTYKTFLPTLAP